MSEEADFLDFEITVRKSGDDYLLRAESGGGQAEVVFTSPFNEDKKALMAFVARSQCRGSAMGISLFAGRVSRFESASAAPTV